MKTKFKYKEISLRNGAYRQSVSPLLISDGLADNDILFDFDPVELGIWIDIYARQSKEQVYFYDGNLVREYANGKEI